MKGRLSVAVTMGVFVALLVGLAHAEPKKEMGKKEYVGSETCKKCHKIQYESWKETLAIRSDKDLMREIKTGLAALKARKARLYTLDELFQ